MIFQNYLTLGAIVLRRVARWDIFCILRTVLPHEEKIFPFQYVLRYILLCSFAFWHPCLGDAISCRALIWPDLCSYKRVNNSLVVIRILKTAGETRIIPRQLFVFEKLCFSSLFGTLCSDRKRRLSDIVFVWEVMSAPFVHSEESRKLPLCKD